VWVRVWVCVCVRTCMHACPPMAHIIIFYIMILLLVQDSTEWCSEVGEELESIWKAVVVAGLRYYPTVCME